MKRHQSRIVTRGYVKLASAVKDGVTQTYWYYMWVGSKWYLFDIRDVAERTSHGLPKLTTPDELEACKGVTFGYELLLQRDLQAVAVWCAAINARDYINRS